MLVYDETQLREPNLLIPGKKPVGPVTPHPDVVFSAWPERAVPVGLRSPPVMGSAATVVEYDDPRYGKAWENGGTGTNAYVRFLHGDCTLSQFTCLVQAFTDIRVTSAGILGNWATSNSQILLRHSSGNVQLYFKNASGTQYGPSSANGDSTVGNDSVFIARYDGSTMTAWANTIQGNAVSASGVMELTDSNPMSIGYVSGAQNYFDGRFAMVLMLRRALTDAEIQDIVRSRDFHQFLVPA